MVETQVFKTCQACGDSWSSLEEFIADDGIVLVGYQANFMALKKGLFLFNHSCQGMLFASVDEFSTLYDGPMFPQRLQGTEVCPDYCLHGNLSTPCPNCCECVYVREILRQLRKDTTTT